MKTPLKTLFGFVLALAFLAGMPAHAITKTILSDTYTDTPGTLLTAHHPDAGPSNTYAANSLACVINGAGTGLRANSSAMGSSNEGQVHPSVTSASSMTVDVDVHWYDTTTISTFALNIGSTSNNGRYQINCQGANNIYLARAAPGGNGSTASVATAASPIKAAASVSHHFTLSVVYNSSSSATVTIKIDGTTYITYTDNAPVAGPYFCYLELYDATTTTTDSNGITLDNLAITGTETATANVGGVYLGGGNQTVTLAGANTNYNTSSTSQFVLSGGTGASVVSQSASDTQTATLLISPGTAAGTLTITGPDGETTTLVVAALTAPTAPAIALNNSGATDTVLVTTTSTAGSYSIGGYTLFRGTATGQEGGTAIATSAGGVFTGLTRGAYFYTVEAYDSQGTPLYSTSSNEVNSAGVGVSAVKQSGEAGRGR